MMMKIAAKRDSTNAAVGFSAIFCPLKAPSSLQVTNIFFYIGVLGLGLGCARVFWLKLELWPFCKRSRSITWGEMWF